MAKILVGFMGAGKSTVARLLDPDYIDMDEVIEKRIECRLQTFLLAKVKRLFVR